MYKMQKSKSNFRILYIERRTTTAAAVAAAAADDEDEFWAKWHCRY